MKLRIISGKYKGRNLKGFSIDGTRPTMDRVKESLFAMIQSKLKNAIVLDLFAGSGNLGLEALSNGAKKAIFVDKNNICIDTIKNNIESIKIEEETIVLKSDYKIAIKELISKNIKVDLVFLDPPYHENLLNDSIDLIVKSGILNDEALLIIEYEEGNVDCSLNLLKEREYGNKKIRIYEYKNL